MSLFLHWLVAGLLALVIALGWLAEATPRGAPSRDLLFSLHRSVGLTIVAAAVLRIAWRWRHPPPPLPASVGRAERAAARATHYALYLMLIAMPLSGYANAVFAGHPVSLFGLPLPRLLPQEDRLSQFADAAHLVGQYVVYLFVALHLTGAFVHGALRRDGVLERMLPRRGGASRRRPG